MKRRYLIRALWAIYALACLSNGLNLIAHSLAQQPIGTVTAVGDAFMLALLPLFVWMTGYNGRNWRQALDGWTKALEGERSALDRAEEALKVASIYQLIAEREHAQRTGTQPPAMMGGHDLLN